MSKLKIKQLLKRASALMRKGESDEAVSLYNAVLAIDPDNYHAKAALKAKGMTPTVLVDPPDTEKRSLVANFNQGNFAQAVVLATSLAARYPKSVQVWKALASAHASLKNYDEAITGFKRVVELDPNDPDGYLNLGAALQDRGLYAEAAENYRRTLQLNPNYVNAHFNLGNALKHQRDLDGAIQSYQQTIQLSPNFADAHGELANALDEQSKYDAALPHYETALKISPSAIQFEVRMKRLQQQMCDFSIYDDFPDLLERVDANSIAQWNPFILLAWEDNPKNQLTRAQKFIAKARQVEPLPFSPANEPRSERIRIGYFSADFHDHATLFLMAGLLREHDHTKFEIFAYSYGANTTGAWRKQAMGDVDEFHEVANFSEAEIVALARSHSLDIAIDLKGFTAENRLGIFGYRLAPVQVSYLGYPGSLGASFMDYIVADPVLIPAEHRDAYSEHVIYLPHTYQPTDNARQISEEASTRADYGLPDDAFVFCSFNNSYKIGRDEFHIWMRVLREMDDSVLWLIDTNEWSVRNLRKEAERMGVHPSRLIFAKRAPQPEHLARHKHADLFLDSFFYNAHTTASDALWGGLPIVTKAGKQFSARVAASILTAIGLEELITHNNADYERMIIDLATNPEKLRSIREKLSDNIPQMPLFDTERYTRNFENALMQAHAIQMEGMNPRDIVVTDPV